MTKMRVLIGDTLGLTGFAGAVLLISWGAVEFSYWAATPTPPVNGGQIVTFSQSPTPTPTQYRDCPYCHEVIQVDVKNGLVYFRSHDFVRFPITETTSFETCRTIYFRYIGEAVAVFKQRGAGRVVDNNK